MEEFLVLLMADNTSIISNSVVELLHFILTTPKYSIETVRKSEFDDILILSLTKKTNFDPKKSRPTHIFKVIYSGEIMKFPDYLPSF